MLRSLSVAVLLAGSVLSLQAQSTRATEKGSVLVGGSAAITRTTSETGTTEVSSSNIFLNPRALFFVAHRLGVGGDLSLGRSASGGRSSSGIGVGPAIRYYLAPAGRSALPYIGAAFRAQRSTSESPTGQDVSNTAREFEGVLGVDFMISRQVGIVAEAFASKFTQGSGPFDADATAIGIRFGIDAFFLR
ncbi:MAG: outer membrane beta-barrel protein [Gemmatimonadetes bacterium]|nr:outer membrane beta-barrel protein [Gemmatimonadota bacterium]